MNRSGVVKVLCACAMVALGAFALPGAASAHPACTVIGTPGPDVLHGTSGPDVICGGGGNDVVLGRGGNDILIGGPGEDRLEGGAGDDLLVGGPGQDVLDGGAGRNDLRGGAGANQCGNAIAESGCPRDLRAAGSSAATGPANGGPKAAPVSPSLPGPPPPEPIGGVQPIVIPGGPTIYPDGPINPPPPEPCVPRCPLELENDHSPAEFWFMSMGRAVDVTTGAEIELSVNAWDPSGIASVTADIVGPSGAPWRTVEFGETYNNVWTAQMEVPAGTQVGLYRVESLELVDSVGNAETIGREELAEFPNQAEFSAYEDPDTEAPTLESLEVTPQATETTAGPVTVKISGRTRDAGSGVKSMWVTIAMPGGWADSIGAVPTAGTQSAGTQTTELFKLPRYAHPGAYPIQQVELEDFAGNKRIVTEEELAALGFPTRFEATGPGDTTAPEILGVSQVQSTIPASGGTVETLVHVRDDLSGFGEFPDENFGSVWVSYEWPVQVPMESWTSEANRLVSGNLLDGTWRVVTTLDASAPPGRYKLLYVGATDRAGNGGPTRQAELEARGLEAEFTKLP
jgi:hypothetical protein